MKINGKKAGAAVIIGCAAACAGVSLVPLLLGGVAVGGIAALEASEGVMVVTLLALGAIGAGVWYLMKRKAAPAGCDCAPDGPCNTGTACDLPG